MKPVKFNPLVFKGKKAIYVSDLKQPGICTVWDWSNEKKKYIQRQVGLKYHAYKKMSGKQFCRSFDSYEEAKKWRCSLEIYGAPKKANSLLFKEVARKYFEHRCGRVQPTTFQTMQSKYKHLKFFEPLPMDQVTASAIDYWLSVIKKKNYLELQHTSRVSYRHELSVLRQIVSYYYEYLDDSYQIPLKKRHLEDCIVDPIRYKESKARNQGRYLSREECQTWIDFLFKEGIDQGNKIVFAYLAHFQFNTGTRIGEACALDWKDIDLDSGTFRVSKTVQWARGKDRETVVSQLTKTGEDRIVPLLDEVKDKLQIWKQISGRSKGFVFSLNGFRPIEYRPIQYQYNKAFVALGIDARSTHILRHSFATDFLRVTHNQLALSKVLGHSSLKQTEHYAKITALTVENGVDAYNKSLKIESVVNFPLKEISK